MLSSFLSSHADLVSLGWQARCPSCCLNCLFCCRRYNVALWCRVVVQSNCEEHWHRIGDVAIVLMDLVGNRILPDGTLTLDRPVIGTRQHAMLETVVNDTAVNWIIVVSSTPLVHAGVRTLATTTGKSDQKQGTVACVSSVTEVWCSM